MQVYGTMWDSAAGKIPAGAALSALYINGRYAVKPDYGRGRVYIDVLANDPTGALWLDVERGDATAADVPGWLDKRRSAGLGVGGVYCSLSSVPAVESAANGRAHLLWLATLDGNTAPIPPRVSGQIIAWQIIPASMLGFDADESFVIDASWWSDHAFG
jgi:hypothetical protein